MRYALISDIHEDAVSLSKALKRIEREGCDAIVCLGDLLGFNPRFHLHRSTRDAQACLEMIKSNCISVIPGNHDLHAIEKIPVISDDFPFPENWFQLCAGERKRLAAGKIWLYDDGEELPHISASHKEWLAGLPEVQVLETSHGNILLSHYAYPNLLGALTHFYYKAGEFKAHKTYMQLKGCYLSFIGHLHPQGLVIASWRMKSRRPDRSDKVKKGDCVAVPAIVDTGNGGGFCIFNTEDQSVTAIRY